MADPRERVNAIARKLPEWPLYALGLAYACWYFWLGAANRLGPEPISALEHVYGETALKFLIAGLCVSPLRRYAGINLLKFRRALGLIAFFYVALHLAVWLGLDIRDPARIWADILKRPYITIGMVGFALLVPLAVTSNGYSVRRLGPTWNKLHRLVYFAVPLGGIHFFMLRKGFQLEPLVYLGVISALLAVRFVPRARARQPVRKDRPT